MVSYTLLTWLIHLARPSPVAGPLPTNYVEQIAQNFPALVWLHLNHGLLDNSALCLLPLL